MRDGLKENKWGILMGTMEILVIALVILFAYNIFRYFRQRTFIKVLTEEQFREGYRKAQLIDVREPQEFERGHILGARNIPVTQMKQRLVEMRKDKDRKSTRLNSSHVAISYAVFCL